MTVTTESTEKPPQDMRVGSQPTAAERARTGAALGESPLQSGSQNYQSDPKCGSHWQSRGRGKDSAGGKLKRQIMHKPEQEQGLGCQKQPAL